MTKPTQPAETPRSASNQFDVDIAKVREQGLTNRAVITLLQKGAGYVVTALSTLATAGYLKAQNPVLFLGLPVIVLFATPLLIVSLFVWAFMERRLRLSKTEALTKRITQLEQERDPNRTSSGLTSRGETNPVDRG